MLVRYHDKNLMQFPLLEIIPGARYIHSLVYEDAVYDMAMVNVDWGEFSPPSHVQKRAWLISLLSSKVYGFCLDLAIGAYTAKA